MVGSLLLAAAVALIGAGGWARAERQVPVAYRPERGPVILSFAPGWTDPALMRELGMELLRNTHGSELETLRAVELRPGAGNSFYTGRFRRLGGRYRLAAGQITLYVGNERAVAGLARTLAHEYGHHFTYYWLAAAEGVLPRDAAYTRWAEVRGLYGDPRLVFGGPHPWDPAEIMAEDYVQLFGSPGARAVYRPADPDGWPGLAINVWPQENRWLPLAHEVPGLEAFWRSTAGLPPAGGAPPERPRPRLAGWTPDPVGVRVRLRWEPVGGDGPVTYTVLAWRPRQEVPVPLAVTEEPVAEVRVVPRPELYLQVTAVDAGGRVVASDPLPLPDG